MLTHTNANAQVLNESITQEMNVSLNVASINATSIMMQDPFNKKIPHSDRVHYSYIGGEHFSVRFFGDSVVFVPDHGFVGSSSFVLVADSGDLQVRSNNFTIEVKDVVAQAGSVAVVEENVVQLRAEVGKPVKFKKDLVLLNIDETTARSIDVYALFGGNISLDKQLDIPLSERHVLLAPLQAQSATLFFEKEPPVMNESIVQANASWKKQITISSPEHYEEVAVVVNITPAPQDRISVFHVINGIRQDITQNNTYHMTGYDEDKDGLLEQLRWIVPHLSNQTFEIRVNITILNVQSYPAVGGVWEVYFNTTGTADLWISGFNGTVFGKDLEFLSLRCGTETVQAITLNNSFLFRDFSCSETGIEQSIVMTPGKHTLEFQFGSDVKYAFNNASINGSNANMTISDQTDSEVKYSNEMIEFFTKYTNSTTGNAINGTGVFCTIRINASAPNMSNMTFDPLDLRYEFNRTFSAAGVYIWNVTCDGSVQNHNVLTTNDTALINKTDYEGTLTTVLDNGLKTCNELVNITVNVTNVGNTNFTGNLSIDLFYSDPLTFYQNLANLTPFIPRNFSNISRVQKNITECPFNRSYTIMTNFTAIDEINGTEIRNDSEVYTFPLWSFYFGQILGNLTLRTPANRTLFYWQFTNFTGNIFVADADSQINWLSLFPMGIKNDSSTVAANDFNETDLALNITETRNDSIMDLFSSNGTNALNFSSFNIFGRLLNNASVAKSTNTSNYLTSMLWDMSDSTDTEFNLTEKEDIVFVSQILVNKTTINGTYDYEIRVPYRLNTYKGSTESVAFYAQLT